jgi:type I restriction enzyme, S subunit
VLKKAFEGELTKEWREKQKGLKAWESKTLDKIGFWTGGGTPSKSNIEFWENGDVLWVSPKDMKTSVISDSQDKITKDAVVKSSAKWVEKDSILFVVRSGIIRRTLPVAIAGVKLTTNQDMMSLTLNGLTTSKFTYWFCKCEDQAIRDKCSKDGTTVDNINSSLFKSYPISIPSIKEQDKIVQEIETRFSVADKLVESIDESLLKAEALRQSILKKAFEGELLSKAELDACRKEADWEPAEKLLERIKREKK